MDLSNVVFHIKEEVDRAFRRLLQYRYSGNDSLSSAIRYALEGEGKRIRPILCILSAKAKEEKPEDTLKDILPAAIAVEVIHTYSLIHDDLPSMDNDDLRRGRPTVHKVFGEAEALLVGDALLTDAFGIIAQPENYLGYTCALSDKAKIEIVAELAHAAGSTGMVLGQSQDLYWTGRQGANSDNLSGIHLRKTGCLLGAAAAIGGITRGCSKSETEALKTFGEQLGLAFQITDDLLDEEHGTGKSRGKDSASGKLTYLTFMSRTDAEKAAEFATHQAKKALSSTSLDISTLVQFSQRLLARKT